VRGIRHNLQVLTEVLQTESTKMEVHIEKKCRGAEGIILTQTQEKKCSGIKVQFDLMKEQ
jgi:hypothetical protein